MKNGTQDQFMKNVMMHFAEIGTFNLSSAYSPLTNTIYP